MLDIERTIAPALLRVMPIFPLPNVVFLPGMVLPLNVFEPRYLDLVDHVVAEGKHIGVPLIRRKAVADTSLISETRRTVVPPGGEDDDIEPVFGVGKLIAHQRLADGRRFIRLEGVGRVRLLNEAPRKRAFREVEVEALVEDSPIDSKSLEVLMAQVERLARTFELDEQELVRSVLRLDDPRVIVYAIASLIPNIEAIRSLGRCEEASSARLALQQECLNVRDGDERIALLLERTERLVDDLGASGAFPVTMMN